MAITFKRLLEIGLRMHAHKPLFRRTKVIGLGAQFDATGRTATVEPGKPPRRYNQRIEHVNPHSGVPLTRATVAVSCTCPDFKYRWDWVLHKNGASFMTQSIDQPPVQTNPGMRVGICRHLTVVMAELARGRKTRR